METEIETIVWNGWPPAGATRDELIASVRLLMAKRDQDDALARAEHAAAMDTWRATIADRLLALIPKLEKGESSALWQFGPSIGSQREFEPPRLYEPLAAPDYWLEDKIAVLEALPDGPVSDAVRRAVGVSPS